MLTNHTSEESPILFGGLNNLISSKNTHNHIDDLEISSLFQMTFQNKMHCYKYDAEHNVASC